MPPPPELLSWRTAPWPAAPDKPWCALDAQRYSLGSGKSTDTSRKGKVDTITTFVSVQPQHDLGNHEVDQQSGGINERSNERG